MAGITKRWSYNVQVEDEFSFDRVSRPLATLSVTSLLQDPKEFYLKIPHDDAPWLNELASVIRSGGTVEMESPTGPKVMLRAFPHSDATSDWVEMELSQGTAWVQVDIPKAAAGEIADFIAASQQ